MVLVSALLYEIPRRADGRGISRFSLKLILLKNRRISIALTRLNTQNYSARY
jgi:hypothetical protein